MRVWSDSFPLSFRPLTLAIKVATFPFRKWKNVRSGAGVAHRTSLDLCLFIIPFHVSESSNRSSLHIDVLLYSSMAVPARKENRFCSLCGRWTVVRFVCVHQGRSGDWEGKEWRKTACKCPGCRGKVKNIHLKNHHSTTGERSRWY